MSIDNLKHSLYPIRRRIFSPKIIQPQTSRNQLNSIVQLRGGGGISLKVINVQSTLFYVCVSLLYIYSLGASHTIFISIYRELLHQNIKLHYNQQFP